MRYFTFTFLFLFVFISAASSEDIFLNFKYPFEQGTITYQVNGMEKGSQILYAKDYGMTTAMYKNTSMKLLGMAQRQETIEITTPNWIYNIDLIEETGSKQVNPMQYMQEEYNHLSSSDKKKVAENAEKSGMGLMNDMQGTVKKNAAKILGYSCDVSDLTGVKVYTVNKTPLMLKTESNLMGMASVVEATKIDKGSVSAAKFIPPANIQLSHSKDADIMAREMAKNTIENLRTGEMRISPQEGRIKSEEEHNSENKDLKNSMKMLKGLFGN